jgi:hypothetical protein
MMHPQPSIFSTVPSSHLRGIGLDLMAASRQRRRLWPAVLLSLGWPPELLAVLTHDHGGRLRRTPTAPRSSMKVHSAAIRLTTSSDVKYRRHRHHLAWTLFGPVADAVSGSRQSGLSV